MRLLITTPTGVILDRRDVMSVRAEDESGGFGILTGHADLLTALAVSVVNWRQAEGGQGFCAVRRGVLTVSGGAEVAVATRQALVGDDLEHLETVVLDEFRSTAEAERTSSTESMQLQMRAIRQIVRYLRPPKPGAFGDGA